MKENFRFYTELLYFLLKNNHPSIPLIDISKKICMFDHIKHHTMATYYHKFEVRWSDIDANRCLANAAYADYCTQTRMGFMNKHKMGLSQLNRWGIAPVILHEEVFFFQEIYADQEVYVSLELAGLSEDAGIYKFIHRFYLADGSHCATVAVLGVWIDSMIRKMTSPPNDVLAAFSDYKTQSTKLLSRETLKNIDTRPENIDPSAFLPKKWTKIQLRS